MDIRNVGKSDGIERTGDRPKRAESKRDDASVLIPRDEANISAKGRARAASVESLASRARLDDGEREGKVTAAAKKLANGELETVAAVKATAQRLVDADFLSE